jgi:hypothetical protein
VAASIYGAVIGKVKKRQRHGGIYIYGGVLSHDSYIAYIKI